MPFDRKTEPDTILLHGDDNSRDRQDGTAQEAITPGQLVKVDGYVDTGIDDSREVSVQNVSGSKVPLRVAIEYSHTGRGIDDDYSAGEHMEFRHLKPGERAYCFLSDGANVDVDDLLVTDGAGGFEAPAAGEEAHAQAVAAEAVDNSEGSESVRIRVEAI